MIKTQISRKKASVWNLVFSYSTILYAIFSGVVMVPLYLCYIPLELYGAWMASGNILNWLLVVDPGVSTVLMQRVGKSYGATDYSKIGEYALGGIFITGVVVTVATLGGIFFSLYISSWVNLTDSALGVELQTNFILAVFASAIMLFAYAVGAINLGMQASFAHGLSYLSANTLSLITTAILLFCDYGLMAISIGLLVRSIIFAGGGLTYMLWRLKTESAVLVFSKSCIKEMLELISFSSLGRIGSIFSHNMDAFTLARFLGPEAVPILVLSRRGMSVAELFLNRMGNAISPSLSHLLGQGGIYKLREVTVRLLRFNLWALGLVFGGFLAFNDNFVRIWVGDELFVGVTASYLLCILLVFSSLLTLMQTLCFALGDIRVNSMMQFFQSLITFAGMLVGVYYFGIIGAVTAPLLGFATITLWYYPRSLSRLAFLESLDWKLLFREGAVSLLLSFFLFILFVRIEPTAWWFFILTSCVFFSTYTLLLITLSPMARSELCELVWWLKNKLKISCSRGV